MYSRSQKRWLFRCLCVSVCVYVCIWFHFNTVLKSHSYTRHSLVHGQQQPSPQRQHISCARQQQRGCFALVVHMVGPCAHRHIRHDNLISSIVYVKYVRECVRSVGFRQTGNRTRATIALGGFVSDCAAAAVRLSFAKCPPQTTRHCSAHAHTRESSAHRERVFERDACGTQLRGM